jgi:hypothetical protein
MGNRMGLALLALVTLLGAVACGPGAPTSNHDPERYGTIRVRLHPSIETAARREIVADALEMLEPIGPAFVLVGSASDADVTIQSPPITNPNEDTCWCVTTVYREFSAIHLDAHRCFLRAPAARTIIAHAIEVYLGMVPQRSADLAIINNDVGAMVEGNTTVSYWNIPHFDVSACFDPDSADSRFYQNVHSEITQADIDEFIRTHP